MAKVRIRGGKHHGMLLDVPNELPAFWKIAEIDPEGQHGLTWAPLRYHIYYLEEFSAFRRGRHVRCFRYVPEADRGKEWARISPRNLYPKQFS